MNWKSLFKEADIAMCAACSGLYKACAAAPISLGFENVNAGGVANPFPYSGLDFTAISSLANPDPTIVLTIKDANTASIPEVESGVHALEAEYTQSVSDPTTQSLIVADSNSGGGGAFVAISAYLNGQASIDINSASAVATVSLSGMLGAMPQPNCSSHSFPFNPPGTSSGPDRVFFADIATDCTVDALTLDTTYAITGTIVATVVNLNLLVSLDDFVDCKANSASGLQGVLPG